MSKKENTEEKIIDDIVNKALVQVFKEYFMESSEREDKLSGCEEEWKEFYEFLFSINDENTDDHIVHSYKETLRSTEYRHFYAPLSKMIFRLYIGEAVNQKTEYVLDRIKRIYSNDELFEDDEDNKVRKSFLKLYDHINLTYNQITNTDIKTKAVIDKAETEIKKVQSEIEETINTEKNEIEGSIKEQKDEITKKSAEIENVKSQLIGIVSIFVAISFVMFGGMTLINNVFDFSGMNYIPLKEMICLGSLLGLIVIAAIYSFLVFVIKITGKEMTAQSLPNRVVIYLSAAILVIFLISAHWSFASPSYNVYNKYEMKQEQQVEKESQSGKNSLNVTADVNKSQIDTNQE